MTYIKVVSQSPRMNRIDFDYSHRGKTPPELEFERNYNKWPTERELAQYLPFYNSKNKLKNLWK